MHLNSSSRRSIQAHTLASPPLIEKKVRPDITKLNNPPLATVFNTLPQLAQPPNTTKLLIHPCIQHTERIMALGDFTTSACKPQRMSCQVYRQNTRITHRVQQSIGRPLVRRIIVGRKIVFKSLIWRNLTCMFPICKHFTMQTCSTLQHRSQTCIRRLRCSS